MNVVNEYGEKQNGFAEVVAFCHVMCRYFDRFLLQVDKNWRQACFFYLAPGLICEGYWQVNSRRSIFRIADPSSGIYFIQSAALPSVYLRLCMYMSPALIRISMVTILYYRKNHITMCYRLLTLYFCIKG